LNSSFKFGPSSLSLVAFGYLLGTLSVRTKGLSSSTFLFS